MSKKNNIPNDNTEEYDSSHPIIDDNSTTPLHLAASNGNIEEVIDLIKNGANVNAPDSVGYTPLFYAIFSEKLDIVELLTQNTATDVNAMDSYQQSPLYHAVQDRSVDIVRILIDKGANVTVTVNNSHNDPILLAESWVSDSDSSINEKNNILSLLKEKKEKEKKEKEKKPKEGGKRTTKRRYKKSKKNKKKSTKKRQSTRKTRKRRQKR